MKGEFTSLHQRRLVELLAEVAPETVMGFEEAAGFLFGVSQGPDLVTPGEWMPEVLGTDDPEFPNVEVANELFGLLVRLHNATLREPTEDTMLPVGCTIDPNAVANLEPDAPLRLWVNGFFDAFEWLGEFWESVFRDPWEALETQLVPLMFFASPEQAQSLTDAMKSPGLTVAEFAQDCVQDVPLALADLARLGTALRVGGAKDLEALVEADEYKTGESQLLESRLPFRTSPQPGRNDLCPCGSGAKYKRCCGAAMN